MTSQGIQKKVLFYYIVCKKRLYSNLNNIIWHQQSCKQEEKLERYRRSNIIKWCVWLFVLCQSQERRSSFLFFYVKGNNLGSSRCTFISFECKLLIITFNIWWSFSQEKKRKRHDMVKNMFLSLDCKSSSSFWWSCFAFLMLHKFVFGKHNLHLYQLLM